MVQKFILDEQEVTAEQLRKEAEAQDRMFKADGVRTVARAIMILENAGYTIKEVK